MQPSCMLGASTLFLHLHLEAQRPSLVSFPGRPGSSDSVSSFSCAPQTLLGCGWLQCPGYDAGACLVFLLTLPPSAVHNGRGTLSRMPEVRASSTSNLGIIAIVVSRVWECVNVFAPTLSHSASNHMLHHRFFFPVNLFLLCTGRRYNCETSATSPSSTACSGPNPRLSNLHLHIPVLRP